MAVPRERLQRILLDGWKEDDLKIAVDEYHVANDTVRAYYNHECSSTSTPTGLTEWATIRGISNMMVKLPDALVYVDRNTLIASGKRSKEMVKYDRFDGWP